MGILVFKESGTWKVEVERIGDRDFKILSMKEIGAWTVKE